jgi:hypothetical protein
MRDRDLDPDHTQAEASGSFIGRTKALKRDTHDHERMGWDGLIEGRGFDLD